MYIWNMSSKDDILVRIRNAVRSTEPGAKIILYGSFARGDNMDESDMDILILVNKEHISRQDEKRIKYPLYEIEFDSGQIISPIVLPINEWETRHKITPFYQNILSEGIEL